MMWKALIAASAALCLTLVPMAQAQSPADITIEALNFPAQMQIVRDEGLEAAANIDRDMLDGAGGAVFAAQVDALYDVPRMVATARKAVDAEDPARLERINLFLTSPVGQRITTLELTARRAMMDDDAEAAARAAYETLKGTDDPRLIAAQTLVDAGDLIETNVSTSLTVSYQFYKGLVAGGGLDMTENQIIAEVWAQEDEMRADTESWLMGFLLLICGGLSADDLDLYVRFWQTPEGRALTSALFDGYGDVYSELAFATGQAAALYMRGPDAGDTDL